MASSLLFRRLNTSKLLQQNPSSLYALLHSRMSSPTPNPPKPPLNPIPCFPKLPTLRAALSSTTKPTFYTSDPDDHDLPGGNPSTDSPEYLEDTYGYPSDPVVGPTVKRNTSRLADETRQSLDSLRGSVRGLSNTLALLGGAHLGVGAWAAYSSPAPLTPATVQGVAAFALPFTLAFLLRRSLKPMTLFRSVEEKGRLRILTYALEVGKTLDAVFVRSRVVCICCVVGVSAGSVIAILLQFL